MPRTSEAVLTDLTETATALADAVAAVDALREKRESLWAEARQADPPVTMRALAEASGVSEPLVIRTMKAHRASA